jgi:hypothetical protein
MTTNVFRMHGYRGEHRAYYYLTPVIDEDGMLVPEHKRNNTNSCNEWSEPRCHELCRGDERSKSCSICTTASVFAPMINLSAKRDDWRDSFARKNHGLYFQIWDKSGVKVQITSSTLKGHGGGELSGAMGVDSSELGRHREILEEERREMNDR